MSITNPKPQATSLLSWSLAPLVLLCLAAFLAPLIGGTVSVDNLPLEPGYSPLMRAIFGGAEAPILSHFVIAMLICSSVAIVLVSRRVIQVPMPTLSIIWMGFFGFIVASVVFSSFVFVSLATALEWVVYGIAGFAAVAIVGRRAGPTALMTSLFAGCVALALLGIRESIGAEDPTWRIFGTWQNPNAMAGMLLIGFFVGIGLSMSSNWRRALIFGAGSALIGVALFQTGSRGAFYASGLGLLFVLAFSLAWLRAKSEPLNGLLKAGLCVAVALFGIFGMISILKAKQAQTPGGQTTSLSRVADVSSTREQSVGFRLLLWKSAAQLIKEKPLGWGSGTYRFESARPGLTTQTHFAHNSYLQLGAECGLESVILFFATVAVWLFYFCKGARKHEPSRTCLRIGILAAILAVGAHSFVDSDLHYLGIGLAFFMLLGVGLELSADGVTPESVLPFPRWSAFAVALLLPVSLLYFGAIEVTKAHVRDHLAKGAFEDANEGISTLNEIAGGDGENGYLAGMLPQDAATRESNMRRAAERSPSTKNLRAYARAQQSTGYSVGALSSLKRALELDPNNLLTLKTYLDVATNEDDRLWAARRLLEVETTPYFKTRALPDLVPTETYFARRFLADHVQNNSRTDLLKPAFDGLLEYASRTVPNVVSALKAEMPGYAGETRQDALEKLALGKSIATELAKAYRMRGETDSAEDVDRKAKAFDEALASLG